MCDTIPDPRQRVVEIVQGGPLAVRFSMAGGSTGLVDIHDWHNIYDVGLDITCGYVRVTLDRNHRIRLHRLLIGATDAWHVDHINGDTTDNRRRNLRLAKPDENRRNINTPPTGTSKYRGVRYRIRGNSAKWYASIGIEGRSVHVGSFDSEIAAAHAYDEASREHHGAFGRLNFPKPGERDRKVP